MKSLLYYFLFRPLVYNLLVFPDIEIKARQTIQSNSLTPAGNIRINCSGEWIRYFGSMYIKFDVVELWQWSCAEGGGLSSAIDGNNSSKVARNNRIKVDLAWYLRGRCNFVSNH
jgi:hypothetical protein